MIQNKELVAVAVSGGKDSFALRDVINQMAATHNFRIKAITIDEGIPGYRNEALEIVQAFCAKLNVEHKVFSYKELFDLTLDEALDLRGNEKTSSCSICGTLRRVVVVDAGAAYDPLAAALETAGIPAFRTMDRAMRALSRLVSGGAAAPLPRSAPAAAGAAP